MATAEAGKKPQAAHFCYLQPRQECGDVTQPLPLPPFLQHGLGLDAQTFRRVGGGVQQLLHTPSPAVLPAGTLSPVMAPQNLDGETEAPGRGPPKRLRHLPHIQWPQG